MDILYCESDYAHQPGEFSPRNIFPAYFISSFSTPFVYEMDAKYLPGNAGDFLIMPPQTIVCQGAVNQSQCYVNDWICVSGEEIAELLKKYPIPIGKIFRISKPHLLKECIEFVKKELLLQPEGYQDMILCCVTQTIIEMYRLYMQQKYFHSPIQRVESAREVVLSQLEKNWTLQEMSEICDYSPSRFSAIYHERFGCSPKADLLKQRINRSKQLLEYTNFSITEIAQRCGFGTVYYFSKYFKEHVGMPPSEYMKIARNNLLVAD